LKIGNTSSAKLVGGGPGRFVAAFGFDPTSCPMAWNVRGAETAAATARAAIPGSKNLMVDSLSAPAPLMLSRGGGHFIHKSSSSLSMFDIDADQGDVRQR
jgi:hypothetical protein